jgi:deoxyribodipyrimidine photo-lyase
MMIRTGLFWFTHDLRLHDQPALLAAAKQVNRLICVYCVDSAWFKPGRFDTRAMGDKRKTFVEQSLADLSAQLAELGQQLLIIEQSPSTAIADLIHQYDVKAVFSSRHAGFFEQQIWQSLQKSFTDVEFVQHESHTLFSEAELPFELDDLPVQFSHFRSRVQKLNIAPPDESPISLPKQPEGLPQQTTLAAPSYIAESFIGGEQAALTHLERYFSGDLPATYKETRNELDGWQNSTRFSAWLANGCLSPKLIIQRLKRYEQEKTKNDSTHWILFELLWREYFQWYAHKHQQKLFIFKGVRKAKSRRCFYPERYQKWCKGNTPYPLVNACMKQLNETGYLSNRGRQIVASCFVNELNMDWRYGAAYMEQQLIDFDVAVNWANWQYIAGVGADPRGGRHFNLEKQTKQYDPMGEYISRWKGEVTLTQLDSRDAADWPI